MYPLAKQIQAVRATSTPLVALQTPDPQATEQELKKLLTQHESPPMIRWDCVAGVRKLTPEGDMALQAMPCATDPFQATDPKTVLADIMLCPQDTIVILHNMTLLLDELVIKQALQNLRDRCKTMGILVLMLGSQVKLPAELQHDVVMLDEPLPTQDALQAIIVQAHEDHQADIDDDLIMRAADAISGLSSFSAEQETHMAFEEGKLNLHLLWERKRVKVEQTPGLAIWRGGETFDDIAGLDAAKEFYHRIMTGRESYRCVVWLDEVEKAMAGAQGGDLSGVSQDAHGVLLSYMEDTKATGTIAVGPPGSGKSLTAKALGATYGIPTVRFDLGGMKGSLMGQSEGMIRGALKVIQAISGGKALFLATSNNIAHISPEFKRRFKLGIWMYDLPHAEERPAIWDLYIRKYALQDALPIPPDKDWTGADIAQCCQLAWQLMIPLVEAGKYVIPVAVSARERIEQLRKEASGRYLSASKPGLYTYQDVQEATLALSPTRRISAQRS